MEHASTRSAVKVARTFALGFAEHGRAGFDELLESSRIDLRKELDLRVAEDRITYLDLPDMNRRIASVALIALVLRLGAVFSTPPELTGDAEEYASLGRHLRFRGVYSMGGVRHWGHPPAEPPDGRLVPSTWRMPGFPLVFAVLWGGDPKQPPTRRVQVFNAFCGSATAALTSAVTGSALAGVVVAVWPLTVATDTAPYSEALFTVLMMIGLWLWKRRRVRSAGIALGLAALTRVAMLPCLMLLPFVSLLRIPRRREYLIVAFSGLLTFSPWVIRNAILFHKFIPMAVAGSGTNLLAGTIPVPLFTGGSPWQRYMADPEFYRVTHGDWDDYETERLLRVSGFRSIAAHPFRWISARVAQYPRLLVYIGEQWYLRPWMIRPVKIACIFLSVGLVTLAFIGSYSARRDFEPLILPAVLLAAILAMHLPMMVETRLGAPLVPLWVVFASRLIVGRGRVAPMGQSKPASQLAP